MAQALTVRLPAPLRGVRVVSSGAGGSAQAAQTAAQIQAQLDAHKQQIDRALAALEAAAAGVATLRAGILKESEGQLVTLAMSIASKVLAQEIQAGRYQIDPIVQEALASIQTRQDVVVYLNPRDMETCGLARQEPGLGKAGGLRFVADAAVGAAQCRVETVDGMVESSTQARLEHVAQTLAEGGGPA